MKDDIIRTAREAGAYRLVDANKGSMICISQAQLERFAALVIANHPPQSSIAWQEGNEAGRLAEREACAALVDRNAMGCENPIYRSLLQANAAAIRAMEKT